MIGSLGFDADSVFEMLEGDSAVFRGGFGKKGDRLSVQQVLIDGGMGDVGPVVIKDREQLSTEGVYVVVIPLQNGEVVKGKVEIITRGFIYVKESKALMGRSKDVVNKSLDKHADRMEDWGFVKHKIENDLEKFLYKETGRNPMIIVHSISL